MSLIDKQLRAAKLQREFAIAEERITKEMITDYHKKEQDDIEKRLG